MDTLAAVATTMDSEVTLAPSAAPDSPIATTIATMEAAAPAEAKRPATGSRDAKPKAVKKVMSKEEKGFEAAKHRDQRRKQKERNAAAAAMEASQLAWQIQLKGGTAQVGLHPSLAEAYILIKREGIAGVAPPASSVSSVSSQLRPGTPAPVQVHAVSRFASGVAPVQFNGAPVPDLNRTPSSGDSCPGATHKTRQVPEESMPVERDFIGEEAAQRALGLHTTAGAGQARRAAYGVVALRPPPTLLRCSGAFGKNRRFGLRFVDSENIARTAFRNQKAENRNWHCGILLIG
ncbi:hypothetical protein QYE76_056432 [Lolium multiflorum]|uniref:Uncharacterized protein n=1 Tax=Lolium multiflorum TaxID=4521 RepID=A0AAD8WPU8_LOLMU|nr:hypothetical protein QYE76_056432 [Lolium multiflorum]